MMRTHVLQHRDRSIVACVWVSSALAFSFALTVITSNMQVLCLCAVLHPLFVCALTAQTRSPLARYKACYSLLSLRVGCFLSTPASCVRAYFTFFGSQYSASLR